ncbi:MAG TPA: recombination regulator RecX [Burkholderiales bacterium]|nr:recombination regulator RecX [Burkholderiales bacterium]
MDEKHDTPGELKARALKHLVRREHSRAELARKLAPHAESPAAVEAVLDSLLSRNQQSDERFASERARVLSRKYGAAKIRQDLKARGVSEEIVDRLSGEGELDRAKAVLERKYRSPSSSREETAKRARFLQGRGFSYDVIRAVLKEVDQHRN